MRPPQPARVLGYAGLLPFFAAAVAAYAAGPFWSARAIDALALYGAVILSFMGGCRWGFAAAGFGSGPTYAAFGASVVPALVGFFALGAAAFEWIETVAAIWVIVAGFVALYLWDALGAQQGETPPWWLALRGPLTAGAAASLALGAVA